LNADKGVTHGKIVEIMELVQKSGLTKLAVTTKVKG
jgi:biopolymer transport protein ExbD